MGDEFRGGELEPPTEPSAECSVEVRLLWGSSLATCAKASGEGKWNANCSGAKVWPPLDVRLAVSWDALCSGVGEVPESSAIDRISRLRSSLWCSGREAREDARASQSKERKGGRGGKLSWPPGNEPIASGVAVGKWSSWTSRLSSSLSLSGSPPPPLSPSKALSARGRE